MADEKSLTITSDYVFKKVFGRKELAQQLIEKILKTRISQIDEIQTEKAADGGRYDKGVRYDILIKDDRHTRIDVEMQAGHSKEEVLALRSRYYQSRLDQDTLKPGEPYPELGNSYIIFLCDFAIFRGTRCRYTFRNICEEDRRLRLKDRSFKIFLSSKGKRDGRTDRELRAFLDYMNGGEATGGFLSEIDEEVRKINSDPKTKEESGKMSFIMLKEERDERIYDKGRADGKAEGIDIGKAQGIEIGEKRGEEKATKSCIIGMLKEKFPLDAIARINSASKELIRKIAKENGLSCDY
jgi:predicted transposase/invertase (TIGR01784 family)